MVTNTMVTSVSVIEHNRVTSTGCFKKIYPILNLVIKTVHACPPNFETLIGNFEDENKTLN